MDACLFLFAACELRSRGVYLFVHDRKMVRDQLQSEALRSQPVLQRYALIRSRKDFANVGVWIP